MTSHDDELVAIGQPPQAWYPAPQSILWFEMDGTRHCEFCELCAEVIRPGEMIGDAADGSFRHQECHEAADES